MATRWGIASVGLISTDFVLALSTLPTSDHVVVAAAARDLDRAKKFARDHGVTRAYGTYEELAQDSEVDVVYIGTINPEHLKLGKLFLNAGKPVLCEKPLCMNQKEVKELVELARTKKVFLMEAVWSRCHPLYSQLTTEINSGKIGQPFLVQVDFGVKIDHKERVTQRKLGGSALLDIGIYCIQFALFVLGRPTTIKAIGSTNSEGVDDSIQVLFGYPEGKSAVITIHSKVTLQNEGRVFGTLGSAVLKSPFWTPLELVVNGKSTSITLPEAKLPFRYGNSAALRFEAEEVRQCLLAGKLESSKVSLDESLEFSRIEDEIRRQFQEEMEHNIIWTSLRGIVLDLDICRPISMIACFSGMSYPVPQWHLNLSNAVRIVWKYFFKLIEWTEIFMVVSLVILIYQEAGSNIGVAIECPGSLACVIYAFFKGNLLFRKQKQLDALVNRVHEVAEFLMDNPVGNMEYMHLHAQNYDKFRKYSVGKFYFMVGSVIFMIGDLTVRGLIFPSPNRPFPMKGYIPFIDRGDNLQFLLVCLAQFLWYMVVGLRDVFGDTTLLMIVAAINVQFVHLKHVMEDIIDQGSTDNIKPMLRWWVNAHQQVLGSMEDAKPFTGPLIFTMYVSASILSFFVMIRLTEDPEFTVVNLSSIAGIVAMNMVHLYVFSYLGDTLAANSQELGWAMMRSNLWELGTDTWRTTMIILTRCTRPTLVVFGDNRVLSASSCGDILTGLFGYFNTIYSLRHDE